MRTNIVLDDELIQEAFRYANVTTKKEIVHLALKEFVENAKKLSLLELKGKISFDDEYDYKAMRDNRVFN
ncbi:MAG TPA: type II toxin-antitoxin system VapB family antitoxin [Epsilonproteobacteria bacterium]|nr:type II toxin-antitoxin system VapB family antitoxin [Campylobacterota bacterium]